MAQVLSSYVGVAGVHAMFGNTGSNPVGTGPGFRRRFVGSSGEPGSFEPVETLPRLKRLLRKKVGTETTRRRITAAPMPLIR